MPGAGRLSNCEALSRRKGLDIKKEKKKKVGDGRSDVDVETKRGHERGHP